jgi:nitrogen fixation NifU-like protein
MDSNLRRTIILENYSNPFNKGLVSDDSYKRVNMNNESCIDNIDLMIKIDNNNITDIRFDGEACAISTSATSIIIKTLLNKSIDEALHIIKEYEAMINEEEYNADLLGEAIVYDEIYKQPNRKKCALLPVNGIKKVLEEHKGII